MKLVLPLHRHHKLEPFFPPFSDIICSDPHVRRCSFGIADLSFLQSGFSVALNPATTLSLSILSLRACFHWDEVSVLQINCISAVISLIYCTMSPKNHLPQMLGNNQHSVSSQLSEVSRSPQCPAASVLEKLCLHSVLLSQPFLFHLKLLPDPLFLEAVQSLQVPRVHPPVSSKIQLCPRQMQC